MTQALQCQHGGVIDASFLLPSSKCNAWAASITLSAWDTVGFVRYLYLMKTVLKTRSDRVFFTWIMRER